MKKTNLPKPKVLIFICFIFLSCIDDEDRERFGFEFTVSNKRTELRNVKIIIGGIKNNEFISTDSYSFPVLNTYTNNQSQEIAKYDNRWLPDLDKIRAISDTAYFSIQLEGKSPNLLYDYREHKNGYLVHLPIPEGTIISTWNDNPSRIDISIKNDTLGGYLAYYIESKEEMW
jgi:hypothetical protein|tara:strand:+ start:70 stop:588 length:519 start_codon:yes stop_codon:yes gene_type:complete